SVVQAGCVTRSNRSIRTKGRAQTEQLRFIESRRFFIRVHAVYVAAMRYVNRNDFSGEIPVARRAAGPLVTANGEFILPLAVEPAVFDTLLAIRPHVLTAIRIR